MPSRVKCPSCATVLMLPDTAKPGSSVRCPKCSAVLRLSGQAAAPAAPKLPTAVPSAKPTAPPVRPAAPPTKGAPKSAAPQPKTEAIKGAAKSAAPQPKTEAIKRRAPKLHPEVSPAGQLDTVEEADVTLARPKAKSKKGLLIGCGVAAGVLLLVCGGVSFGVYRLVQKGKQVVEQMPDGLVNLQPQKKKFDVSFIHADCMGAIILQPSRIAKSSSSLLPPPDKQAELFGPASNPAGVDFRAIEQAIVLFEPAPPGKPIVRRPPPQPKRPPRPGLPAPKAPKGDDPVVVGFIVRFANADAGKPVVDKMLAESDAVQMDGKTIYRHRNEKMNNQPMAGATEGDRTLLFAPEPMLRKMLAAKDVHSPLTDRLRDLELENDLFGLLFMASLKPALKEMMQSPQAQQQFPSAKNLHEDLVSLELFANLDSDKLLQIVLKGQTDVAAKNLEDLVEGLLAVGKVAYPQFRPMIEQGLPPDVGPKLLKVVDQVTKKEGITVLKEGANVTVTLNKPKDL